MKFTLVSVFILLSQCFNSSNLVDLAIENVRIYNPKTRTVLAGKTILIKGDRIFSIIDANDNFNAKELIKGGGRLVSPGFIDTHVHINQMYAIANGVSPTSIDEEDIELMQRMLAQQHLKYGTTTIIDMGHPEEWIPQTINWQKNQVATAPNIFINGSSTISDEEREPAQHHHEVMSPEDAREKVRRYSTQGIKYMKLYSRLRKPEMLAIAEIAEENGIILNAHVDNGKVTIQEAMEMGVRNFEHFFTVLPCVLDYDEHWGKVEEKYGIEIRGIDGFSAMMSLFFLHIDGIPEKKKELESLFELMARKGASISTTIHVLGATAGRTDFFTSFNHFPIRQKPSLPTYSPVAIDALEEAHRVMMSYLKMAYDKGVKIRIGTDCRYGGRSMVSELKLLASAGFSAEEIFEIATINGYESMGLQAEYGRIESGMKADLLLFKQSPLENTSNFAKGKVVIKDGVVAEIKRSLAYEVLDKITSENLEVGLDFYEKNKANDDFESHSGEMHKVGYDLLGSGLIDEAMEILKIADPSFKVSDLELKEKVLNNAGYALVAVGDVKQATKCFIMNTVLFPESWNVWDSLAEAYMSAGSKELAIQNYEKSLALNPENDYAIKALKQLKL